MPAIECLGCSFKVETRDEPATDEQMSGLTYDAVKIHLQELQRVEEDLDRYKRLASYRRAPHRAKFRFYPDTPDGFKGRIVSGPLYH